MIDDHGYDGNQINGIIDLTDKPITHVCGTIHIIVPKRDSIHRGNSDWLSTEEADPLPPSHHSWIPPKMFVSITCFIIKKKKTFTFMKLVREYNKTC